MEPIWGESKGGIYGYSRGHHLTLRLIYYIVTTVYFVFKGLTLVIRPIYYIEKGPPHGSQPSIFCLQRATLCFSDQYIILRSGHPWFSDQYIILRSSHSWFSDQYIILKRGHPLILSLVYFVFQRPPSVSHTNILY